MQTTSRSKRNDNMLKTNMFRRSRSMNGGTFILLLLLLLFVRQASAQQFTADTLTNEVFARMKGKSFAEDCSVSRAELRYLRVSHYDAEGRVRQGELVCHRAIAADLLDIFRELYRHRYPIERMTLIDDYDADDEQSMRANNTSCFNYRKVAGSRRLSAHSRGMAIDINPLYNPCVRKGRDGRTTIQPSTARRYADRKRAFRYKLVAGDLCHRLFLEHGFEWGGAWRSLKDYQHFEKK